MLERDRPLIEIGQKVIITNVKSKFNGSKGEFKGFMANGYKIKLSNGEELLCLSNEFMKIYE